MRIPAQIHTYEGARPRALPEGLGFPVEKIEDMSAGAAEEHIAALYGDELYGLELDGEVSGEGMPHRFDACFEIRALARRLRTVRPDGASRSESAGSHKQPRY